MFVKKFRAFESLSTWDDFINKVKIGERQKDPPDEIVGKLSKLIPSDSKVLDISVGYGQNSEYFIERGFDVYGTDISELAIKEMKEIYPDYNWIVHDTLEKFPFKNNYFDLIFARLSLHYFKKEDVDRILLDIFRMTKINGYFYVMVKCSNTGNLDTGKISYTSEEWLNMILKYFSLVSSKEDVKKAYSFEKFPSNVIEIIARKKY